MITFPNLNDVDLSTLPETLRPLMRTLIDDAEKQGLLDLTFVLIVEAGDTEDDITEAIGWSPLVEPLHGIRYDEPGFYPYWDHLDESDGWYSLVLTVGNDGFAYILFVEAVGESHILTMFASYV
jgi:hypothetical protein